MVFGILLFVCRRLVLSNLKSYVLKCNQVSRKGSSKGMCRRTQSSQLLILSELFGNNSRGTTFLLIATAATAASGYLKTEFTVYCVEQRRQEELTAGGPGMSGGLTPIAMLFFATLSIRPSTVTECYRAWIGTIYCRNHSSARLCR